MLSINRVFPSRTAAKTRELVLASLVIAAKVSDSRISRYSTAKPACCNAAEPSAISRAMAKELTQRGFKFCGPTIVYAFMQAVGMVNDHLVSCHRHDAVQQTSS